MYYRDVIYIFNIMIDELHRREVMQYQNSYWF